MIASRVRMGGWLVVVLLIAAVAALAGAERGSTASEAKRPPNPLTRIVNQLKGLKPAARERKLVQMAKAEGNTLEWYTSLSSPISRAVEEAFEKQFDITVNRYRAGSEDLSQRIIQEARAGRPGADVVETNGTEMLHFQHRDNVLAPYWTSPYRKAIPKNGRFETFTASRMEYFIVAWNKNLLPSGGPPRSYHDLASSRFKGKLSMEPTDQDWYSSLWQWYRTKMKWSPRRIDTMFRNMAKNAVVTSGHTTQANLLAAGQFAVVVSAHAQSVKNLIKRGAPLEYRRFVRPVLQRPQGVGIVYRLRHPATAMLFVDWFLSRRGQKVLQDNESEPARRDMMDTDFRGAPLVYMNLRPIIARWRFWSNKYEAVLRNAGD